MLTIVAIIALLAVIFFVSFFVTSKIFLKGPQDVDPPQQAKEAVDQHEAESQVSFCPYCGAKLSEHDKFCPNCGKNISASKATRTYCPHCNARVPRGAYVCWKCFKKLDVDETTRRQNNMIFIILMLVTFIIFLSAVFSKDSDSPAKSPATTTSTTIAVTPDLPTVGDTLEIKGVKVKFNVVKESKGSQFSEPGPGNVFVLCEFTIENNSSSDIGVSSLLSFECYVDDYSTSTSLGALMDDAVTKQLDGTVAPGKKMRGYISYEVPRNWSDIEIHFIPYLGSTRDFVFYYSK